MSHLLFSAVPNPALSTDSPKLVLTRPRLVTSPRGSSPLEGLVPSLHSLFSPLGMAVPQREARDPTVAKLSPHHPRNSWQMYASALPSVFNHTQCSMLTPFSPLPLNCSTIDHEGLRLRSFIGFQRGPSDCCYGLPNTCCCKSKPDPMRRKSNVQIYNRVRCVPTVRFSY